MVTSDEAASQELETASKRAGRECVREVLGCLHAETGSSDDTCVAVPTRAELGMDCKRACEGYATCLQCIVLHAAAFCCLE